MTDHYQRPSYNGNDNGGGDRRWPAAVRQPRRPNKKFTTARKFGVGGQEENSAYDNSWRMMSSPPPCYFQSYRRTTTSNYVETCETVEWETMSKHFARLPGVTNGVEKFQNRYSQTNLPHSHHLQYYNNLHKLHQIPYVNRSNPAVKKPPVQQRCCKPWQWVQSYGPNSTFSNAYYLSDPGMYGTHAKDVVQDDLLVNLDKADQFSLSIWRRYLDNRQSNSVYDTKMSMWRKLSAIIKKQTLGCGLYMVGSTMNGFGGDVSDADFCLLTGCTAAVTNEGNSGHSQVDAAAADERHRVCGVERLQWLMGLLEQEQLKDNIKISDEQIVYAKVPILRFRWTDDDNANIDVDLCCNNVVGIRNTHLLYCYSRLDYRVRPLVLTIKLWASYHNINDPKKMTLSSYSLVLMVINFLQCINPPVLPSLQCIYGMKFSADTNIEFVHMHERLPTSGWRSENKQSLGELLFKFFEHYNDFNYYKYAVSVRMGSPILLERCRMAEAVKNDPGQWKFIGIEEPFERTNTARSVHNHNIFAQIREIINKSHNKLKETMSLDSIFCKFEK